MALYEFFCPQCQLKFEQITSDRDPDQGKCPKCQGREARKLISRFWVGGQGDLRETTYHGCHHHHVTMPGEASHSHDPGHDHSHGHAHEHSTEPAHEPTSDPAPSSHDHADD